MNAGTLRFRLERTLGRIATRMAATLTFGEMPPFVSTSGLVVQDGKLLVVLDSLRHEPVLPGGHLKWRETPEQGMVREVEEETGYHVEPGPLLGVYAGEEWAGEPGILRVIYEATVRGGTLRSSREGEVRWLPVEEVAATDTRDAALVRIWQGRQAGAG